MRVAECEHEQNQDRKYTDDPRDQSLQCASTQLREGTRTASSDEYAASPD
jgi:hypothetical protein